MKVRIGRDGIVNHSDATVSHRIITAENPARTTILMLEIIALAKSYSDGMPRGKENVLLDMLGAVRLLGGSIGLTIEELVGREKNRTALHGDLDTCELDAQGLLAYNSGELLNWQNASALLYRIANLVLPKFENRRIKAAALLEKINSGERSPELYQEILSL